MVEIIAEVSAHNLGGSEPNDAAYHSSVDIFRLSPKISVDLERAKSGTVSVQSKQVASEVLLLRGQITVMTKDVSTDVEITSDQEEEWVYAD